MTAVDQIQPSGRPMDLNAVLDKPDVRTARPDLKTIQKAGFSFGDFIDVINPLQHIPGVAELYRSVTNDQISDDARKAGNVLYGFALGGPVGVGAMMAYNAVGDRMADPQAPRQVASSQVAETAPGVEAFVPETPPLPPRKPETDETPLPKQGPEATLLGTSVAAAGQGLQNTPPLAGLLNGTQATMAPAATAAPDTAASSVAYVDIQKTTDDTAAVIPNAAGLDRLATHQSNRLPLDVLKVLQERHAERTASERT